MKLNTPEIIGMFMLFTQLIATQLDAQERLERSEAVVATQTAEAQLREQFVAVLGHDLRNPLSAIDDGVRHLARQVTDERSKRIVDLVHGSVRRMAGLIDRIMDTVVGHIFAQRPPRRFLRRPFTAGSARDSRFPPKSRVSVAPDMRWGIFGSVCAAL